jgi:hypothetical protein
MRYSIEQLAHAAREYIQQEALRDPRCRELLRRLVARTGMHPVHVQLQINMLARLAV